MVYNLFPREPLPQASYWKLAVFADFHHGVLFNPDDEWDLLFDQKAEPLRSYELAISEEYLDSTNSKPFHNSL